MYIIHSGHIHTSPSYPPLTPITSYPSLSPHPKTLSNHHVFLKQQTNNNKTNQPNQKRAVLTGISTKPGLISYNKIRLEAVPLEEKKSQP